MLRKLLILHFNGQHHQLRCVQTTAMIWDSVDFATPIITVPYKNNHFYLKRRFDEKRKHSKGRIVVLAKPGKKLITCSEHKYNLHTNEFPTKFKPLLLASESWTGPKSTGKYFTIHATRENQSLCKEETIESLQLTDILTQSLKSLNFVHPTKVQSRAIPITLQGLNVMFVAETGSGKTLSYILPICNKLLTSTTYKRIPGSPSAVVLVPTKELSKQVENMSQKLELPLEIRSFDNPHNMKEFVRGKPFDIAVSTPMKLLQAIKNRCLSVNEIQCMVVDECDSLLDESFSNITCDILSRINIVDGIANPLPHTQEAQLILCSATFPPYAEEALNQIIHLDDITSIQTGYAHRLQPHIEQNFIRVKPSEKFATLVSVLENKVTQSGSTMVFCNNAKSCNTVAQDLVAHGINAAIISKLTMNRAVTMQQFYSGERNVLITTDISSRGINTNSVRHVINYDFPNAMSDYIHRAGRCGRVDHDSIGKVINLISRKWEVPNVMKVEEAARKRECLQDVNANIRGYLQERLTEKKMRSYNKTILKRNKNT